MHMKQAPAISQRSCCTFCDPTCKMCCWWQRPAIFDHWYFLKEGILVFSTLHHTGSYLFVCGSMSISGTGILLIKGYKLLLFSVLQNIKKVSQNEHVRLYRHHKIESGRGTSWQTMRVQSLPEQDWCKITKLIWLAIYWNLIAIWSSWLV